MTEVSKNTQINFKNDIMSSSNNQTKVKVVEDAQEGFNNFFDKESKVNFSAITGNASTQLKFVVTEDLPEWPVKTQTAILNSFKQGLKQNNASSEELTNILKTFNISGMEINEKNVQDSDYSTEVKKIQEFLNTKFANPELEQYGISHKITVDGKFSKKMVEELLALKDSIRGKDVSIDISPIKQINPVGCYMTAEAMLFNAVHLKDGTVDAYTEFDARARIADADLNKTTFLIGASSENTKGRITIKREKGIELANKIDSALNENPPTPVIAGISYRKQNGHEYNEGITDHYVLIKGRGTDANGTYYTFNDPAQGHQGILRFDPVSGKLSGRGDMAGIYDASMVTKYELKPEATENYKKMGKVIYYPGHIAPEIKDIQKKLNALSYITKGTDGKFGSSTVTAINQFQKDSKLPETGKIDTKTLAAIDAAFTKYQKTNPAVVMYKTGENSPTIAQLQINLNKLGFKTNGTTGQFGPATDKAVQNFQKANGITVSGKIDNQTWLKITELANAKR
jgi:peptidoglycan hydrolase-like protein with peptidoglycan-binding domain